MKAKEKEAVEALERLREWVKPGETIWCVLRSVSRTGMSRVIDFQKFEPGGRHLSLGWNIAKALGMGYDRSREGVKVTGCGMDMGFHIVYNISRALWPDGVGCTGPGCNSNDHNNGDRDYTPHLHADGGYALNFRWI